jgi:signal transduction histidine kinase/ActR/RegA family two-component response regulator
MLGGVIILLSGMVLAGSAVLGVGVGVIGAAGVLCVYATLLFSDLLQFAPSGDRTIPAPEDLITSPVRALRARFHGLVMRAEAFQWQGEQVQALSAGVRRDPLFRELVMSGGWRAGGAEALAGQVARYLKARSRAAAVATQVWNAKGTSSAFLGVDGERFKGLFERQCELVRQGVALSPESGLFEQFGFPKALMRAGLAAELGGAVVWIGFPEGIALTPLEERFLGELAEAVSDELRYSAEVAKLTAGSPATQKPAMLAQFSHDIRSPLSNVKAILALLRLEELRPETVQLVEVALSNCRGVEAVVEDVIDISRMQAGKLQRKDSEVELEPLIDEVVEGFRVTAKMRGLSLSAQYPRERLVMRGDRNQLRRMVTNLLSNALKYTKFGAVTVTLARAVGDAVEIRFADTGVGMSKEQVARLFEPFTRFQGDDIEGVGLGLSIVKTLTAQHDGVIEVESTPGKGSVFVLRFPLAQATSDGVAESREASNSGYQGPRQRILVVDDDADLVRSLAKLLTRDGHEVLQAVTVHDALSIVNFDNPDLVLTDAAMPSGGGRRILQFITDGRRDIPVVFLSGDISKEQEFKALGAAAVLEKPCDFEDLRALLLSLGSGRSQNVKALG